MIERALLVPLLLVASSCNMGDAPRIRAMELCAESCAEGGWEVTPVSTWSVDGYQCTCSGVKVIDTYGLSPLEG